MIQRLIHLILQQGFAQVLANTEVLKKYFRSALNMGAAEAAEVAKYFSDHPPKIVLGYARANLQPPILSVILAQEREDQQVIGMDGGMIEDPTDPEYGADVRSSVWSHTHQVMILVEDNPDLTLAYYEVAKRILLLAKPEFIAQGLHDISIAGQELAPDSEYTGGILFGRTITISSRMVFDLADLDSITGRAWRVRGLAVDDLTRNHDVGGVQLGVTVSGG